MDRPFLRFNDYLGLSSVLQRQETNETLQQPSQQPKSQQPIQPPVICKENLKRIDEIIYCYELKHALKLNMEKNRNTLGSQRQMYSDPRVTAQNRYMSPSSLHSGILNNNFTNGQQAIQIGAYEPPKRSSPTSNSNRHFQFDPTTIHSLNSTPTMSPCSSNINSPNLLAPYSPSSQMVGVQNMIKNEALYNQSAEPKRLMKLARLPQPQQQITGCSFCRNNKEVDEWVASHQLKDYLNRVTCPVLRSYKCPLCGASGDNAHTLGHCPSNAQKRNCSLPLAVRRRTNATGRVKL